MLTLNPHLNSLTERIIGAAISVHRALGPGLLESAYQHCLAYEFAKLQLRCKSEYPLPAVYEGVRLDCGYRADFIVEGAVIVEVKSIEALTEIHLAQMLAYLRLSKCPVGLLINFNVRQLTAGLRRVVNDRPSGLLV